MQIKLVQIFILTLIIAGCASQKRIVPSPQSGSTREIIHSYPGTDSSVVKKAIDYSKKVGVDFERQNQAKQLLDRGLRTFAAAESLQSCIQNPSPNERTFFQIYENWINQALSKEGPLKLREEYKPHRLQQIVLTVLDSASQITYRGKLLDPFNLEIRGLLIKIYMKQGELTHGHEYYTHAIEELKRLLLIDKSNPYIYEKLGECYFALNDWANSYQCFHEAERVLNSVKLFELPSTGALDTTRLVYYLHRQGEAKMRSYDSNGAIAVLSRAMQLTNSHETKRQLQLILDWINWDDGNIRASEIRDQIRRLEADNRFREARAQYLDLLKLLRSDRAKNEINWKIASIEYNVLGRKNEALARLFLVIQSIHKNPVKEKLHEIYLKDYAAMCYSVGIDYLNRHEFRLAYIYFNQSSQIEWDHQGDCFYQLAHLSRDHPAEAIRLSLRALDFMSQLSQAKIRSLYQLLAISYKRMGEFDNANKYFQDWVNLKNITKNDL
ncbi:MAG: hypothetical protein ONB13_07750 [candidate division KSB1 bacterium]|nr:hypothetical protein [candidate division KSB1 bacterium]